MTMTITNHQLIHDRIAVRHDRTVFYMEQSYDGQNTSVALYNVDEAETLARLILDWVESQRKGGS